MTGGDPDAVTVGAVTRPSPFISDVPAAEASRRGGTRARRPGARRGSDTDARPGRRGRRARHAPSRSGRCAPRPPSTRPAMDGIAVPARSTPSAPPRPHRCSLADFDVVDTGDPLPRGLRRRRDARARPPRRPTGGPSCAPPCRPTSTSARSARTSAPPSCCCPAGHRLRPVDVAAAAAAGAVEPAVHRRPHVVVDPDRRRDPPDRHRARAGRDPRHQLAHARRAGRRDRAARRASTDDRPDDPELITAALRDGRDRRRPRRPRRRVERRARRLHRPGRRRRPARWPCTAWRCGRATRSCSARSTAAPRSWARPATPCRPR